MAAFGRRFYRNYADRLSIADKDRLMEAMQLVNRADVFCHNEFGKYRFLLDGSLGERRFLHLDEQG